MMYTSQDRVFPPLRRDIKKAALILLAAMSPVVLLILAASVHFDSGPDGFVLYGVFPHLAVGVGWVHGLVDWFQVQ
jgi:hypothetical protein